MSHSVKRTVSGRDYVYRTDKAGQPEFFDNQVKYESDLSQYLPPPTPILTKAGKVAVRQPYVIPRSLKLWRVQYHFHGLSAEESYAELQARIRAHGHAGLAPDAQEVCESMGWEYYDTGSYNDKAKLHPKKFLEDVFGPQSSSREGIVVVDEVRGWGEPIRRAACELKIACELEKMPNHEMGQRRAVLGLDAIRVRVAVARLDMQARRGVQRDKLGFEEDNERTQQDFKQEIRLARLKDSKVTGPWDVNGTWEVDCPAINGEWFFGDRRGKMRIGTTEPDRHDEIQIFAEFDFHILTGVMRFVYPDETHTISGSTAASFPLPAPCLLSMTNKTVKYHWRCEEAAESEIQLGSDQKLCSITFSSPHAFRGTFTSRLTGTVSFENFKVDEQAAHFDPEHESEHRNWQAHELASIRRWRR